MGHDITATINGQEVAYLRRNMSSTTIQQLYNALDCTELNGGCSGTGDSRTFTVRQIQVALRILATSQPETIRDLHMDDKIVRTLQRLGAKVHDCSSCSSPPNLNQEIEFLDKTLLSASDPNDKIKIDFA